MEHLSVDNLARIAAAGGGFVLDAGRFSVDELARIALAGSAKQSRIGIKSILHLSVDDLARIATAGKGAVQFLPS